MCLHLINDYFLQCANKKKENVIWGCSRENGLLQGRAVLAAGEQWAFLEMPCQAGGSLLLPEKLLLTTQRQGTEHSMKANFVIVEVKAS